MRSWRSDSSMVVIAIVAGLAWTATATAQTEYKLTASDGAGGDSFANSVSIDGDYAIVGAYGDDDHGSYSGSAYIFKRSGTTWSQQQKLTASDAATSDHFGYSVSIDGDYAIVGAPHNDDDGNSSGSAYIFSRSGTSWSQQDKLTASDAAENDNFGLVVSISGDYAIVGARNDDDAAEVASGRHGWPPENPGNQRDGDLIQVDTGQFIIKFKQKLKLLFLR